MPAASLIAVLPPGWVAAGLLDVIGPLLVVAFWVIRQVLVGLKEQRELEKARQEAAERGEPWPPEEPAELEELAGRGEEAEVREAAAANPPAPKPAQADLRSEVEEFLRRASQGNAGAPPPPAKPPKQRPPLDPFEDPPPRKRRQRPPTPQQPVSSAPVTVDLPEEPSSAPTRAKLRHLPESQLAENAAHLGESIATADDRADARMHERFDHRLGKLSNRPTDAVGPLAEPASAAARIRKALVAPGGARDAVILSEILRSPADRI